MINASLSHSSVCFLGVATGVVCMEFPADTMPLNEDEEADSDPLITEAKQRRLADAAQQLLQDTLSDENDSSSDSGGFIYHPPVYYKVL